MKLNEMKPPAILLTVTCVLFFYTSNLKSQDLNNNELEEMYQLSIEDMLNLEVTTATLTSQKVNNVPATMYVITSDQIEKRGYYSLEDVLADLPGFQFRNIQGFNTYSFLRGTPNQNNLILLMIDGVQVNELNSGGFYGGTQYNLSNIEQIEVVYGPASSLYGTNAMSGVINLITKKTNKKLDVHVLGGMGSFASSMGEFSIGHYNEKIDLGMQVSAMFKSTEKGNLKGINGDNNWTDNMENFENDIAIDAKLWYKKFSFGFNYINKNSSNTTYYKSIGYDYYDRNSVWDIYFANTYLNFDFIDNENIKFYSKLYSRTATVGKNTVGYVVKATDSTSGYQVGYFRPNQLIGLENILSYKVVKNLSLSAGLIGELEWLSEGFSYSNSTSQDERPKSPETPDIINNSLLSIVGQAQYKFLKHLNLTAGLRYDASSYYGNVVTPRIALVFDKNKWGAKVMYNNAFRAPRPWDYTIGIGNPDLKPEIMDAMEMSISYNANKFLHFEINAYRNIINHKFVKQYSTNDDWFWANKDKVQIDGIDLAANFRKGKISAFVNYSNIDAYDQDKVFLPEIARHSGNVALTYTINDNLSAHLGLNYIGERKNPKIISTTNSDIIDPAFVWNANFRYQTNESLGFALKITNLTDVEYYHTSNRPPDRYRQPQRSILLTVFYNY